MGMMIGIWAPTPRIGRTTIALALISKAAEILDKDKKILVSCANGKHGTLLKSMGVSADEAGLEELVSYRLGGIVGSEYSSILAKKGNISFAGSGKMTSHFSKTHIDSYKAVFEDLKGKYDYCLIDLPQGADNTLGNMLIKKCDRVITVLEQDIVFLSEDKIKLIPENKNIIIVNKYRKIYPQKGEIKNLLHIKNEVFTVSDCDMLREMKNKDKFLQYLTLETDFNSEIKNIAHTIFGIQNIGEVSNNQNTKQKGLFRRIKFNILGGEKGE